MPLFVILSGILYKKRDMVYYFINLLIPYFSLGLICIIAYDGVLNTGEVMSHIISLICGGVAPKYTIVVASPLWYVSMIFFLQIFYTILDDFISNEYILLFMTCILACVGWYVSQYRERISMIYNIDIALIMMPFFHLSRMYGKKIIVLFQKNLSVTVFYSIILFGVSFLFSNSNGAVNVYRMKISGNILFFYLTAIIGTCYIVSIAVLVVGNKKLKLISNIMSYIGKRTIVLLAIHFPIALGYLRIKSKFHLPLFASWGACIVTLVLSIGIAEVIYRFFPFLLGKMKK